MVGDTQLQPFSLADIFGQAQQFKLRNLQMDTYQRQQQEAEAERERQSRERQMTQHREQAGFIAKATANAVDEPTYQQGLAAAKAYGIDVSGAPPTFDPNWVRTQHILASTFLNSPEKLTNTAQELVEAGFHPGSPEFQTRMAQRIAMQDSKVITTTDGGMASLLTPSGVQPVILPNSGGAQPGSPVAGGGNGPPRVTDEASYSAVPAGSPYMAPDGTIRRKPGGQTASPSGNFSGSFRGLPGETVTSTKRSAAHNRAVGGVPNSYHLSGQARDSVPPAGMSMNAYAQQLRQLNPHLEIINEGDHVHMEPRG